MANVYSVAALAGRLRGRYELRNVPALNALFGTSKVDRKTAPVSGLIGVDLYL